MITIPTYATTMCTANDMVAVVLDPTVAWRLNANDSTGVWYAISSYGTIHGISACLNKGGSKQGEPHLKDTNNNETKLVTGSERYGGYCWCRTIHPVLSLWTYCKYRSGCGSCASQCVSDGMMGYMLGTALTDSN